MSLSGTYAFNPSAGDLVLNAFSRCGIRGPQIDAEMLLRAYQEGNLLQVEFANKQPNLWRSELYSQELTASTATYTLPGRTIAILAAFLSTTDSAGTVTDTIITPISTTDYAAQPNKLQEGIPSSFWYDRQITPQITLWPVPDDATTYTLKLRMLSQSQDLTLTNGTNVDVPYRALDAFTAGLAARLAVHYATDRLQMLKALAKEAWELFAKEDQEDVPLRLTPMLSVYFR